MKKVAMLSIFVLALATVASAQPVAIEKYWERLCGLETAGDNVRTLAVSPDGVVATINRTAAADAIKLFQAEPGLAYVAVENLDMGSIPASTYAIVDGDFSDDGVFYACSLSYLANVVLNVYRWPTLDATPEVIFTSVGMTDDWMGYRLGDSMDVIGSESDNSVKIMISGNNALSQPLVLTTADNGASFSSASLANAVRAQDIDQLSDGTFWATYAGGTVAKYNADGTLEGTALPADANGISAIAVDETRGLVFGMGYKAGAVLSVWDIATATKTLDLASDPIALGEGDFGGFANGSASVEIVELGGGTYIYALSERNGCARYSLSDVITVDGVGAGAFEYAEIQDAIDSYCAGNANAGVTNKPLIIEIDPAGGPYDESLTLNDAEIASPTDGGNISGDLVIKSTTDAAKPVIKLQEGISGGLDGIYIYQSNYNLAFKGLLFCPSLTGTTVTDDLLKIDENGGSQPSELNWVEFYDCVVTNVDASGDPMVATKADALNAPPASGSTLAAGDYLIKSWGDAGESRCVFMEESIVYGGPSYGARLMMAGAGSEKVFINNSMYAWNGSSGLVAGSYSGATGTKSVRVTGDDVRAGYDQCTASIENNWHGLYAPGATDGVVKVDNFLVSIHNDAGNPDNDARGVSGSGYNDLQLTDCILESPAVSVVDGITNYPQYPPIWKDCTFSSPGGALFSVSSTAVLNVTDCIISGGGTSFTGTLDAGVIAWNCAFVQEGPDAITDPGDVTENNSITSDPFYVSKDASSADFFDVASDFYAAAASDGGALAGGADFVGGEAWTILDNFEDGDIAGWAEETFSGRDANGDIAYATDDAYDGTQCLKLTLTNTVSSYEYAPVLDIPVSAGDQIAIKAYLKWLGDGSGMRIWGAWNDETNSYMSSASGPSTYVSSADGWAASEFDFGEAPTGAAYFRLQVRVYGSTVPATGYVDYVLAKMPAADAQPGPWGDYDFVDGDGSYAAGDTVLAATIDNADLINGIAGTIVSGGFHPATVGGVAELTNGSWDANGLSVIVADAGTGAAALEVEWVLAESSDIEQIRIFSGHDGDGSRTFINAKVEVDTFSGYELLRDEVKAGYYGMPAPATQAVALAWLYDVAGGNIAENVEKVKISFYDVSHNSTGFMQKFDDNVTNPPVNYPNQGTIVKEVDIIGTSSAVNEWLHY